MKHRSKSSRYLIAIAFVAVAAPISGAASPPPPRSAAVESTVRALEVVRRGVTAMGGERALRDARSVTRIMNGQRTDPGQGLRPSVDGSVAVIDDERIESYLDLERERYFEVYQTRTDEGDRYLWINAATRDTGFLAARYFDERVGVSWRSPAELPALYARLTRPFPEALLRQVLARPAALEYLSPSADFDLVGWADAVGTRLRLRFDKRSGRLAGSELVRDHPFYGETNREVRYADFRKVGGLSLPFAVEEFVGGELVHRYRAETITLDAPPSSAVFFRPPADAVDFGNDPASSEVRKLGGDLYLIRGPYNSLFEVFDEYVVVVEAGMSSGQSEQCIALIESVAGDKPIRYVVATHFHYDHVAGLRPYVHRGATVITTPDARAVITRVATVPHALTGDAYGVPASAVKIETVTGSRVLDDAHHRLEIHDTGPNLHVAQMLIAYSPAHRVLLEADLLDGSVGEPADAGPYTVQLAQAIDGNRLKVETIVPVHGPPVSRQYLDQALAIRRKHVQ